MHRLLHAGHDTDLDDDDGGYDGRVGLDAEFLIRDDDAVGGMDRRSALWRRRPSALRLRPGDFHREHGEWRDADMVPLGQQHRHVRSLGPDLESRGTFRLILQHLLGQQQSDALHDRILRRTAAGRTYRDVGGEPDIDHGRAILDPDLEFEQRHLVQRRGICGERYVGIGSGDADNDFDLFNHLHGQWRLEHGEHHRDCGEHDDHGQQRQAPRQMT